MNPVRHYCTVTGKNGVSNGEISNVRDVAKLR